MADLLSKDIWAIIMTYLPQAERLGACSLVCRKIRAAAAEATSDVSVACAGQGAQQRVEAVGSYLQQHGQQVTSLAFSYSGYSQVALPELPCALLRSLDISADHNSMVKLHWDATSNFSGVVHSCTALTSLKLSGCEIASDSADPLASLSVLVNLVDLKLAYPRVKRTGDAPSDVTLSGSILPRLSLLSCLGLLDVGVDDVHCVSQLQHLSVLSITGVPRPLRLSGFVMPASLQHAAFVANPYTSGGVVLDPAVLSAATQLSVLDLTSVDVESQGGTLKGAALLAAVSKLQRLEALNVSGLQFDQNEWPPLSAAYEALTASNMLRELRVYTRVPDGLWVHAFPATRIMHKMEKFDASGNLSAEEVCSVARSCPCLTELRGDTPHDEAGIAAVVKAIATLTSLRHLSVPLADLPCGIKESTLLPLTALQQLTYCNAYGLSLVAKDDEAAPDSAPIWRQWHSYCTDYDW